MEFMKIKTYLHCCDIGLSKPQIGVVENNQEYVIKGNFFSQKPFDPPYGNGDTRDIFNEAFCYTLANVLDVPVPNWALLYD